MKKYIYLLSIVTMPITQLLAQPVVNNMENNVVGTVSIYFQCDTVGANPGSAGINQVWNLTGLVRKPVGTSDSITHVILGNPSGSSFPTATVIDSSIDGSSVVTKTYINQTGTENFNLGETTTISNGTLTYGSSGLLYAKQPIQYNDNFSTPYNAVASYNGIPINIGGTYSVTVDGYGTLQLPNATYSNVLRVSVVQDEHDTASTGSLETVTTAYYWYDNNHSGPLCSIATASTVGIATPTRTIRYLLNQTPLVSVQQVVNSQSPLKGCFDNNALVLNYAFKQGSNYQVILTNIAGQKVFSQQFVASGDKSMRLYPEHLAAGMYVITLMEGRSPVPVVLKVAKQ